MQMHKFAPLAVAALLATGAAAGAAEQPQPAAAEPTAVYRHAPGSQFDRVLSLLCGKPETGLPEQTPDTDKPEVELPEQTPDTDKPDTGLPEQTPDSTPDTAPEQKPEQDTGSSQGDYASQVVALVNAERAKYGLSALRVDSRVQQAAQVRAAETVQSFSHTRPNGSSFSTALTEAGVSYTRSGENIAYGQSTPQQVVQAWMNSDGHRANILNSSFTTIGVGYTVVNGTAYWAQLFTA